MLLETERIMCADGLHWKFKLGLPKVDPPVWEGFVFPFSSPPSPFVCLLALSI